MTIDIETISTGTEAETTKFDFLWYSKHVLIQFSDKAHFQG